MKYKLLVLSLFASIVSTQKARGGDYEIKYALNVASMTAYENVVGKSGIGIGVYKNFDLNRFFTFQTGLVYNQMGAKEGAFVSKIKDVRANYLDVPCLMNFRLKMWRNNRFRLTLGPYVGFGIGGRGSAEIDGEELADVHTFPNIVKSRFDYGGTMGIAFEFNRVTTGISFSAGMAENILFAFSVGYRIHL